jgi:very-short-patch-repair endonuclease
MKNNYLPRNNQLTGFAKTMRKNPTDEEKKIWYGLLRYITPKFHRQKIIGNYIADFYCPKLKLVIEIDGIQHLTEEHKEKDQTRDQFLEGQGLRVLRFPNESIRKHFADVCQAILHDIEVNFEDLKGS